MNQPPLTSSIQMVPESAWAVDETPALTRAQRATRAARNPDENRMVASPGVKGALGAILGAPSAYTRKCRFGVVGNSGGSESPRDRGDQCRYRPLLFTMKARSNDRA